MYTLRMPDTSHSTISLETCTDFCTSRLSWLLWKACKCVCHQSSLCVWAWESVECGPEAYEGKMSELIPLKCSALSLSTPLCCNFISGNPPGMFSLVCLIWPRGQARQTLCLGLGPLLLSLSLSQFIIPPPSYSPHIGHIESPLAQCTCILSTVCRFFCFRCQLYFYLSVSFFHS